MKIVKPLTLGLLQRPYRYRGANHFSIAAIGFFRLGDAVDDSHRFLTENLQWPLVAPSLPAGRPLDEVMPKMHSEALLSGYAHAAGDKPVTDMTVRLCVGSIDKTLKVRGDRSWSYGLLPFYRQTAPAPFKRMPLTWDRACGGSGHAGNPAGCGYVERPLYALFGSNRGAMPNLEYPAQPVKSHRRRYTPAGFGPLEPTWSPRREKHGRFDRRWLERDAPGYAENVDWSVFNTAPADQWQTTHFSGGECYRLEGVHPTLPAIEGRLPQVKVRAFVQRAAATAPEEVPLQLDTVWFFPEHLLGVAVYHGQTWIDDIDGQDIDAVMLGYEHSGAPRPVSHYHAAMALRLDPETAMLHAFNESQLAPQRSAADLAARAAARQRKAAADLARQQAALDESTADFWAQSGMTPPPGSSPPQAKSPPLGTLSEQDIEDSDFDLSEIIENARALGAQARRMGAEKLAELDGMAPATASIPAPAPAPAAAPAWTATRIAAQKNAAFDRASIIAYDLMPPGLYRGMPQSHYASLMAELTAMGGAGLAAMAGEPDAVDAVAAQASAAAQEKTRASLLQLAALRRKARLYAPTPTAPPAPLAPEVARWLGLQIEQWHRGGACLAGRDLAGADLRNLDFTGADLREVMLEQADLRGASFAGANLRGAVLTGARIDDCNFSGANLRLANLCQSKGRAARFVLADLSQARSTDAVWPHADLSGATLDQWLANKIDLDDAVLDDAHLHGSVLAQAQANRSRWHRADLDKTVLLQASLEHADFSEARLSKAVLMDARLHASVWLAARLSGIYGGGKADWSAAVLRDVRADGCGWHGASFVEADLSGGWFLRSDFGECNLTCANLQNALFSRSLFMRASLHCVVAQEADFFQALCRKTDFSGADLRHANLVQAELTGAGFIGARLDGVQLEKQRSVAC